MRRVAPRSKRTLVRFIHKMMIRDVLRERARGANASLAPPLASRPARGARHPTRPCPPPTTVPSSTRSIIHAVVAVGCASAGAAFSSPSAAPTAFFLASLPAPTENAPGLIATVLVVLFVL